MIANSLLAITIALFIVTVVWGYIPIKSGMHSFLLQFVVLALLSIWLVSVNYIGYITVMIIMSIPLVIVLLYIALYHLLSRRTMNGKYGKEARWAAELFDEGDKEFVRAIKSLPRQELRKIRVLAGSKDELRDLTVEKYNEYQNS